MSGQIRYSDEFKIDAAAQVTERDYPVKEVAERLGVHHVTTQNRLVARYVGFSGVVEYGSRLASFVKTIRSRRCVPRPTYGQWAGKRGFGWLDTITRKCRSGRNAPDYQF